LRILWIFFLLLLSWGFSPVQAGAYEYEGKSLMLSLSGFLESNGVYAIDKDSPDQDPTIELEIDCQADMGSWSAFKLILRGRDDGKVIDPGNGLLFNEFDKIYQDKNPYINIDEAYVDFFTSYVDFRVGIQKFAWGRLDEINPTDNLNTEDLTFGGTNDEIERKIGVPSVKSNIYSDLVNIEFAWIPQYVPYRLPTPEERWFPGVLKTPEFIETNTAVGNIPVTAVYQDIDLPDRELKHSQYGVRASRYIAGWDISLSYYRGYNTMPITSAPTDLTIDLQDFLALDYTISTVVNLVPQINKMSVYGFDFTTTAGSFTIRGEYAYYQNKYFNRKLKSVLQEELTQERQDAIIDEFLENYIDSGGALSTQTFRIDPEMALQKNSMKYGLGVDYIYGDTSVSAQFIQEYVPGFDNDKPVYFIKDGFDTLLTLSFKQFFLQNTLEANLDSAYNLEFEDYIVKPSIKYNFTNSLALTLGAIFLDGKEDDSLIGQYSDNDEVYAKIRFYF
jgi:hypothetical protein